MPDEAVLDRQRANLAALGIDPDKFAAYVESGCDSTHEFNTPISKQIVQCAMRGKHTKHKAIFHGYPMEWS